MRPGIRRIGIVTWALLLAVLPAWIGCTRSLRIEPVERRGESVVTEDGLLRMSTRDVGAAYLRPGVYFANYHAVRVDPCIAFYRSPPVEPSIFRREIGNYRLSAERMDRLVRSVREEFERGVAASVNFRLVGEPGPGVLRASCRIVDLVWEVPDVRVGETFWTKRTGIMTLVLDLQDAESGTVLARLADRRDIRPVGAGLSGGFESRPVNTWAGVRDVSLRWGRILREALDALYAQPPVEAFPPRDDATSKTAPG
jgi:hypothetical protein